MKSQKIASQIEALKIELTQARQHEKQQQAEAARREVQRALASSGLLSLVAAGTLTGEQLSVEFRRMAERVESTLPASLDDAGSR